MPKKLRNAELSLRIFQLQRAINSADRAIDKALAEVRQRLEARGVKSIGLTTKVSYDDPDAERPELSRIALDEDGRLVAVDADDPELTFGLSDLSPQIVLNVLKALP